MPKGLQITDSNEYLLNGVPAMETPEGRAYLEDQQARARWPYEVTLAMALGGRIPGGAPAGAIGTFVGRRPVNRQVLLQTYRDPPRTLRELQEAVPAWREGTDVHHIVERAGARNSGIPTEWVYHFENEVRIPRMKHWEITGWYMTKNKAYQGMSPREYLVGKTWEDHRDVGMEALRLFGVMKP
jgi:hypothetical protein